MATLTYPPIQHPMYASAEDLEKGALSPVWALWFEQMQTHAVTYASEQFFEVYSGEFTDNDPAPGHVSWDKIKVKYNGVRYAVNANGSTDKKYIYWETSNPRVLSAAAELWMLTPYCILVGTNQAGTFVPEYYDSRRRIYNAIAEDGTIAADKVVEASIADLAVTEQALADLAVTLAKLAEGAVDITKCASTIRPPEIFDVLPAAGHQGRLVLLTTDNKLYRDTGSAWTVEVPTTDLSGTIAGAQIANGAIDITKCASSIRPPQPLAAFPVAPAAGDSVWLTVAADATHPANTLYTWDGTTWKTSARATDIIGKLIAGQIEAAAIGTTELAAGAVTTSKLAVIPDNICPDPYFVGDFWGPEAPWTRYAYGAGNPADLLGVANCVNLTGPGAARYHVWGASRPISGAGQTLRLRAKCNNTSNQACHVTGRLFRNDGGYSDISLAFPAGSGVTSASVQSAVPNNTARIVFIVYNQAGSTMTGAMAVSELKLDVAASADLIVDGAVTAVKLAADSVTADKILANNVTAGKIAAGAVGATEIAAKAVTTAKLAVVPETLLPDACYFDPSLWFNGYGGTQSFVPLDSDGANVAHQMGVPRCFYLTGADTTYTGCKTNPIPMSAVGKAIRLRYKAFNNANQSSWLGLTFVDFNNAQVGDLLYNTQAAGSGHSNISLSATVPAGAVGFVIWMRNNGAGMTGVMAFSDIRVELPATADLIVDGAITTNKLCAGAVTATKISVTSLSSLSANIGTVTAGIITGTTIRTTADGSGNYMEISGTSLKGKDSGGSTIWEMLPGQGPLALTDAANTAYEKSINTVNFANVANYGGYNASPYDNTPEGLAAAMAAAMVNYATNGCMAGGTGKWDITSLFPSKPRYLLVSVDISVSATYRGQIYIGDVRAVNTQPWLYGTWSIEYWQGLRIVRSGLLGPATAPGIRDQRIIIVPTMWIDNKLLVQLSYYGSLTGVSGTVRLLGYFP